MREVAEMQMRVLRQAYERGESMMAVHYASGNLYMAKDSPVPVSCISITDIGSQGTTAFSLSDIAGESALEREKSLLGAFIKFLQEHQDTKFIHWNMDKADYGFGAIVNRARWLTHVEPAYRPSAERLFDLDQILTEFYGEGYVEHPKLPTLAALNRLSQRYWLAGKDEAEKAESKDFGAIQRSTSEKSRAIAHLFGLLLDGTLVTKDSAGALDFAGSKVDAVRTIVTLADRLLLVERSLKRRHAGRSTLTVSDEYDVQDLLRSLLVVFFEDVREETWAPEYAGASSRIDFVLPEFGVAVEVKKTRDSMTARTVGEELIVDRDKYAQHPSVSHLVCVVLDHDGRLANPRGLEKDLGRESTKEGLAVTVRIVDR